MHKIFGVKSFSGRGYYQLLDYILPDFSLGQASNMNDIAGSEENIFVKTHNLRENLDCPAI